MSDDRATRAGGQLLNRSPDTHRRRIIEYRRTVSFLVASGWSTNQKLYRFAAKSRQETYRGGPFRLPYGAVMPLLGAAFLSDEEHRKLLAQAGFVEVETQHLPGKSWILASGRRSL
jgi:hypothetical protein